MKIAFTEGYITDDEGWLTMWDDGLTTSDTYDKQAATVVEKNIRERFFSLFFELDWRLVREQDPF